MKRFLDFTNPILLLVNVYYGNYLIAAILAALILITMILEPKEPK